MTVIAFPLTNPRHAARAGLGSGAGQIEEPFGPLSTDEVDALTAQDFFNRIHVDAETGTFVMARDDEATLARYLAFHGLRLPRAVRADHVIELCNDLRWSFGQAIRLALRGDRGIADEFPGLNTEKIDYVLAVAGQERSKTRDLARQVFKGRSMDVFLY